MDSSSKDDFVTPRSLKKVKMKKAMSREMKGLNNSSTSKCPGLTLDNAVKLPVTIVIRSTTKKQKFLLFDPATQGVTPIKDI